MADKPDPDLKSRMQNTGRGWWDRVRRGGFPFWYFLLMLTVLLLFQSWKAPRPKVISYSEFKSDVDQGEVAKCVIQPDLITGTIQPKPPANQPNAKPEKFEFQTVPPPQPLEDRNLIAELTAHHVDYTGERPSMWGDILLTWILPIGLFIIVYLLISRRLGRSREMVLGFGKSPARLVADPKTGVTFADVAGCDEAKFELQEVVDFLKNPDRYRALGAKIPKGVLLVGPPGTGKTLLARAVAGEAGVPFFSMSGSDFVEMFVGVGAARVRDLFQQAKTQAPCIIFIDELDAIGRQRGVHVGTVNDEREQTLNQLLVEMDGFEANVGVIIIGATNRPDVLDRALLRPGRFDRQVVIDAPDLSGREAILRIHSRGKPLAPDVDLRRIAQGTPGFSGADLANLMNEAALLAARRHSPRIMQADLEEAVEKVIAGPERRSRRLVEEAKRRVAYHEVGHALVAAYSKYADPVQKISIIPRGRAALGYTLQLPADDQFLMNRSALIDRIRGMLGGRASEEVIFNEISTGAENDLEHATSLAQQMVCIYGMGESVGLVHVGQRQGPMFYGMTDGQMQRDCSEATAREIDKEVKRILDDAYAVAKNILTEHRDKLDLVAHELLKKETMDAETFNALLGGPRVPVASGPRENPALVDDPHLPAIATP